MPERIRRADQEPMSFGAATAPVLASGATVLAIFALLAVAAGGPNWVLALALVLMIVGFAACYGLVQRVSGRRDEERPELEGMAAADEVAARDLPLDNPTHADVRHREHMRVRRGSARPAAPVERRGARRRTGERTAERS